LLGSNAAILLSLQFGCVRLSFDPTVAGAKELVLLFNRDVACASSGVGVHVLTIVQAKQQQLHHAEAVCMCIMLKFKM
jgi:hypothetical protein